MTIIRSQIIVFLAVSQTETAYRANLAASFAETSFTSHIRQAAVMLGQSKLHVRHALTSVPGGRPHIRRVLEFLAEALQIAIEFAQKLAVSE